MIGKRQIKCKVSKRTSEHRRPKLRKFEPDDRIIEKKNNEYKPSPMGISIIDTDGETETCFALSRCTGNSILLFEVGEISIRRSSANVADRDADIRFVLATVSLVISLRNFT